MIFYTDPYFREPACHCDIHYLMAWGHEDECAWYYEYWLFQNKSERLRF